jgi:uncharacterized protein YqjF (DUF2071 family)
MSLVSDAAPPAGAASRCSRQFMADRGATLFLADWKDALFIHYAVPAEALQPFVPFPLDLWEGRAYVSFVAFNMERMRPVFMPGKLGEWALYPVAPCRFLNLRTYVVNDGQPGIFFLAEWLSKWSSVPLGRPVFGLPYRAGRLNLEHHPEKGSIAGSVSGISRGKALSYEAKLDATKALAPCRAGTLAEFLLERYVAFTEHGGRRRRFHVWHEPWPQIPIELNVKDDTLLAATGGWSAHAARIGAHFSPGVTDVWMGRPEPPGSLAPDISNTANPYE